MASFSKATANFAFNLLHKISKESEDSLFSPTSIMLSLAMTYIGSDGNTKLQMKKHCFGDIGDTLASLNELICKLNEPQNSHYVFVNQLYCRKDFDILQTYRDILERTYFSGITSVEFGEIVRKEINEWVSKATRQKINDVIPPNALTPDIRLLLVNSLYFKGEWRDVFKKEQTVKEPFYISPTKKIYRDMMQISSTFEYGENDHYQAVLLPYSTYNAGMVIILPKDMFGLSKVEKEIKGTGFLKLVESLLYTTVNVKIPKMKFEQSFQLSQALKNIGITEPFSPGVANFSGITGSRFTTDLCISDVWHKSFMEVNENGTETQEPSVRRAASSAPTNSNEPFDFTANHPFLFAIITLENDVLFLGHFYGSSTK